MPSKSQKQHDLMVKACQSKEVADRVGISQAVACEFVSADLKEGLWGESNDYTAIHSYVNSLQDRVQKELTIVSPEELGQTFLLHITPEKNPVYAPRIGFRQSDSEDRTVPRITASPCLFGCIIGYAVLLGNFLNAQTYGTPLKETTWRNGVYIRKLPFKQALRPTKKLVYDVEASDEHWLVSYSDTTRTYPSEQIGKFFITQISLTPFQDRPPQQRYEIFLQLTEGIQFTEKLPLEPGHYCISFLLNHASTYKQSSEIEVTSISRTDFLARKKVVASLLSVTPSMLSRW